MKNNMKHNSKKIARYSLLAITASAILPMACKKEEAEADDPNISVKTFNLSVSATLNANNVLAFDIDGDAVDDFTIESWYSDSSPYDEGSFFQNAVSGNRVLATTVSGKGMATILSKGDEINSSLTTWKTYSYTSYKNNSPLNLGVNNLGDKYTACKFKIGSGIHYGWLKFNVTNAGRTLTLKEAAYDIRADSSIITGAK